LNVKPPVDELVNVVQVTVDPLKFNALVFELADIVIPESVRE
jgi:hypothetical protein